MSYPFGGKNLRIRTDLPASLGDLDAEFVDESGVHVAYLPDSLYVYRFGRDDVEDEIRRSAEPNCDQRLIPFAKPEYVATAAEMRSWALQGFRGVVQTVSGTYASVCMPDAEPLLPVRLRLLSLPRHDQTDEGAEEIPLFLDPPGRMIVPFLGDIHVQGRALSLAELRACGIELLEGETGNPLEIPGLLMGHRSVLIPSVRFFGRDPKTLPKELPLGWRFKGTGVARYFCHKISKCPRTMAPIVAHPDDILLLGADIEYNSRGFWAQRPCYAGQAGVFADLAHQQPAEIPLGGDICYKWGLEMRRRLIDCGSKVACHLTGAATLLTREQLDRVVSGPSGMVAPAFFVTRESWPADCASSLRIDHVTRPIRVQLERNPPQSVLSASANLAVLLDAEFGNHTLATVRTKLLAVCRQTGQNVKAALHAGASLYFDRNSDDNLLTSGLPLDFGDYHSVSGWHQLGALVFRYLVDMHRLARASQLTSGQFFHAGFGAEFFGGFLKDAERDQMAALGGRLFEDTSGHPVEVLESKEYLGPTLIVAAEATAAWVSYKLAVASETPLPGERSILLADLLGYFTKDDAHWQKLQMLGIRFPGLPRLQAREALQKGHSVDARFPRYGVSGEVQAADAAALLLRTYAFLIIGTNFLERDRPDRLNERRPLVEYQA